MCLPIFRGRVYELLALKELVELDLLGDKILPIIEPVKTTPTLYKTLDTFCNKKHQVAFINNPSVGYWLTDLQYTDNSANYEHLKDLLKSNTVISAYHVSSNLEEDLKQAKNLDLNIDKLILICTKVDDIDYYEKYVSNLGVKPLFNVISDKGDFRRKIRANRVMCVDRFLKKSRNADYTEIEDEFFSSDHLYYREDNYVGFSDYSIIGSDYSETSFAPYALAIHIVYLDNNGALRIAHFVSDSNDDIRNPTKKYAEALSNLNPHLNYNYQRSPSSRWLQGIVGVEIM